MIKKQFNKKYSRFWMVALMFMFAALLVVSANAMADTTPPKIVSVSISPDNNEMDVATHDLVTVKFSELMDASTINANTFILTQRTTPSAGSQSSEYRSIQREGIVTYNNLVAAFTPKDNQQNPLQPSQQYGNVFTVTITTGAKDLAGNSLSQNYVWSFTTGNDPFYTDSTTSQTNQNQNPTSGFTSNPSSTQSPVVAASTSQVIGAKIMGVLKSPWFWLVGGLLLILLIASIIALVVKPRSQKSIKKVNNITPTGSNPFGDVHSIMDIEGIGPVYNKELHTMGIKNTRQLWEADADRVAYETGASLSSVKSWQNMAELASVKDIGPQYAELIERSGVHNIDQLKKSNTNKLLNLVRKKQDSLKINIQGNTPGHALVENWINQAKSHKYHGSTIVGQMA